MPCDSGGQSYSYYNEWQHSEGMLCEFCQFAEQNNIKIPARIEVWWDNHKRADEERERQIKARKEISKLHLKRQLDEITDELKKLDE